MNVKQLIEALSKLDGELPIVRYIGDFGYDCVYDLEVTRFKPKTSNLADFDWTSRDDETPGTFLAVNIL